MTKHSIYHDIEIEHPKLTGWCPTDKAITLGSLVLAHRPALTVEVGVFGGSSFIPMAMAHKAIDYGVAVGIDPWDKVAAVQGQVTNEDRAWWHNVDLEGIYQNFMATIRRLELEPWTKIMRQRSDAIEAPRAISLLHIDGAHSDQAVRDVMRFAINVEIGGYCVTDDSAWKGGGPARAEQRLIQIGFKRRYPLGSGAVFQRVK